MSETLESSRSGHGMATTQAEDGLARFETVVEKPEFPATPTAFFSRAYLLGPMKKEHGDLSLLACCFVTGMVDTASFSNWSTFVGMQTGTSPLPYPYP